MKDEIKKHLYDILDAAEEIKNFISGMDFQSYKSSPVTQRAVERDFEIIGESSQEMNDTPEISLLRI